MRLTARSEPVREGLSLLELVPLVVGRVGHRFPGRGCGSCCSCSDSHLLLLLGLEGNGVTLAHCVSVLVLAKHPGNKTTGRFQLRIRSI